MRENITINIILEKREEGGGGKYIFFEHFMPLGPA